jgi:Domain of unknown function (DUF4157)
VRLMAAPARRREATGAGLRPPVSRRIQRCPALGQHGPSCPCHRPDAALQPKLAVGPPGDRYEREADELAGRIVAAAHATGADLPATAGPGIGRLPVAAGPAATTVGEPARAGGRPLSAATRAFMEPRFGVDFSAVRVHQAPGDQAAARDLRARAFTLGQDVWLGRGESEHDRRLMAHELTHVVQQTSAAAGGAVQRQMSCDVLPVTYDIYAVNLPGATRSPGPDIQKANDIWSQCNVTFNLVGGESWQTDLLDILDPKGVLNEYGSPPVPTAEENALLAHAPGGAALHLYYVPSLDRSEAEAFWPARHGQSAVVVGDSAPAIVPAHELGHVLLDSGAHDGDKDNLMARAAINTGKAHLRCAQCPTGVVPRSGGGGP